MQASCDYKLLRCRRASLTPMLRRILRVSRSQIWIEMQLCSLAFTTIEVVRRDLIPATLFRRLIAAHLAIRHAVAEGHRNISIGIHVGERIVFYDYISNW